MLYENAVKKLVCRVLGLNKDQVVALDDNLEKLGMDSIKCVRLIVGLEKKFGVSVPDDKLGIDAVRTIGGIVSLVAQIKRDQQEKLPDHSLRTASIKPPNECKARTRPTANKRRRKPQNIRSY